MSRTTEVVHASALVTVHDVVCSERCGHGRHEEHCVVPTLALVRRGAFVRRDRFGRHVADGTRVLFFDPAVPYTVDHPHAGGDRCTALAFDADTLREAVRHPRGEPERQFARGSCAGDADIHLAHRRLLDAVYVGDGFAVDESALQVLQLATQDTRDARPGRHVLRRAEALAADAQVLLAGGFDQRITLESVATALGVSSFQLCRAFRQATGATVHQHLTRLRLTAALERLPRYGSRLTDLALDIGFSSHSHFTFAFRRYFGRAPSAVVRREAPSAR